MPARYRPWIALLLSIVPGLGQIYLKEMRRGLVILLGMPAQAAIFFGVAGSLVAEGFKTLAGNNTSQALLANRMWLALGFFGIFALIVIWLWNLRDAWKLGNGRRSNLALPILLLIVLNIATGWYVTKIDIVGLTRGLPDMKEIAHSLISPDIIQQRSSVVKAQAEFIVPGPGVEPPEKIERDGGPNITVTPIISQPGDTMTVTGRGFPAGQEGELRIYTGVEKIGPKVTTDADGSFVATFENDAKTYGYCSVQATVTSLLPGWRPTETLKLTYSKMLETIFLALMGTLFAIFAAIPLSFFGARNLMKGSNAGRIAYSATRGLFNVLRSIEVLIIAVMLTKAVGIGPFAGVLALAIHGVGALGKLYSEAIESIDPGPIEAITATGASKLQVVVFGVVPQVVPQFISFTLYRWDINVRMATVIGLVGGGGIGYLLMQYIGLLQWQQAATAIWLIAAVVMLMDYASAVIRERLV